MAVSATKMDCDLVLTFDAGYNDDNKPVTKRKTFSKIKIDASNEALYQVGKALASVIDYDLKHITRADDQMLIGE